ncbi:hypothetical protein CAOG_06972 [Capsaspora owczarzaki ATCC 30864]|uniref:U3 small nucleolar RNA-associated protein 14 n=1 Tax=Capsaspora owczarzaki (strain ATCC 30864) TaxID=595528 RepID=A0A0D2WW74_CAPO3|nr:hypothetical protein CAOG_06972 [Capsaspora owczarzaki ATCC 30864]KJE96693.1 hypothetical protein CAOG_006972 [Capsaspora owczarzaki ATCC 30864]|eukprot:XP_004343696.1 hypothetical protein CAOG_06972 [Capsaspora owczarzaki ATCC 30864]
MIGRGGRGGFQQQQQQQRGGGRGGRGGAGGRGRGGGRGGGRSFSRPSSDSSHSHSNGNGNGNGMSKPQRRPRARSELDVYEEEDVADNPNELRRMDNVDIYEYELPENFVDEEIDEDEAFTAEDYLRYGNVGGDSNSKKNKSKSKAKSVKFTPDMFINMDENDSGRSARGRRDDDDDDDEDDDEVDLSENNPEAMDISELLDADYDEDEDDDDTVQTGKGAKADSKSKKQATKKQPASKSGKKAAPQSSDEDEDDDDEDDDDDDTIFDDDDDDEDEDDDEDGDDDDDEEDDSPAASRLNRLVASIESLSSAKGGKKPAKPKRQQERTEVIGESEFNLSRRKVATGDEDDDDDDDDDDDSVGEVDMNDLLGELGDTAEFAALKSKLGKLAKSVAKNSKLPLSSQLSRKSTATSTGERVQVGALSSAAKLSVPLSQFENQRIQRMVAYEDTSRDISKWVPTVKRMREAEHLSFPLNAPHSAPAVTSATLATKYTPQSDMERQISEVLQASGGSASGAGIERVMIESEQAMLADRSMTPEEQKERQRQLGQMRAMLSYYEAKCKRIKKIKSKTYHRIKNKALKRKAGEAGAEEEEMSLEALEKLDPEAAREQRNQLERDRAEERLTLRHKNTSKWARNMLARGHLDANEKQAMQDQLQRGDILRRRVASGDDGSDDDGQGEGNLDGGDNDDNDDDDDDDDNEDEGTRRGRLDKIESELDKALPAGGLMGLKFMQRALEKKRQEARLLLSDLRDEMETELEGDGLDAATTPQKRPADDTNDNGRKRIRMHGNDSEQDDDDEEYDQLEDPMLAAKRREAREQAARDQARSSTVAGRRTFGQQADGKKSVNSPASSKAAVRAVDKQFTADGALQIDSVAMSAGHSTRVSGFLTVGDGSADMVEATDASATTSSDGIVNRVKSFDENKDTTAPLSRRAAKRQQQQQQQQQLEQAAAAQQEQQPHATDAAGEDEDDDMEGGANPWLSAASGLDDEHTRSGSNLRAASALAGGRKAPSNASISKQANAPTLGRVDKQLAKAAKGVLDAKRAETAAQLKNVNIDTSVGATSLATKQAQRAAVSASLDDQDDEDDYVLDPSTAVLMDDDAPRTSKRSAASAAAAMDLTTSSAEQRKLIERAFANDNVVAEFEAEKRALVEADAPKDEDVTLPGWGAWGGEGIADPFPKKREIKKAAPGANKPRADAKLKHVIINEKLDRKAAKLQVGNLPHPFADRMHFEKTMAMPVGKEWNTASTFHKLVKPKVSVKTGTIIEPLNITKDVITQKKAIATAHQHAERKKSAKTARA